MKKYISAIFAITLLLSCGKLNFTNLDPDLRGEFSADMLGQQADISAAAAKALMKGASPAAADIPEAFCYFYKYEITVHYILATLANHESGIYAKHLILNRDENNGVVLDLATEKLSDKVGSLNIINPVGRAIGSIQIGIGKHCIINGIMKMSDGKVYQTTANGIDSVPQGQTPGPTDFDAYAHDRNGILLGLFFGNLDGLSDLESDLMPKNTDIHVHTYAGLSSMDSDPSEWPQDMTFLPKDATIELICPLDIGVRFGNGGWELYGLSTTYPFVEGGVLNEVYYVKTHISHPFPRHLIGIIAMHLA